VNPVGLLTLLAWSRIYVDVHLVMLYLSEYLSLDVALCAFYVYELDIINSIQQVTWHIFFKKYSYR
jgi:hypothetical protein